MTHGISQTQDEARVWEFADQGVEVLAKSGSDPDVPVDPLQLRAGSRPGSVRIMEVPGVGAEILVDDLAAALEHFRAPSRIAA